VRSGEKGMALILTLMITAILAVLILEFSHSMRVELCIASNYRDDLTALYLAKGGLNYATCLIRNNDPICKGLGEEWRDIGKFPLDAGGGEVKVLMRKGPELLLIKAVGQQNEASWVIEAGITRDGEMRQYRAGRQS
jgi:Tfp pilus assembly protein PilX